MPMFSHLFTYHPLDAQTAHIVHFILEWLAILTGVQTYRLLKKRHARLNPSSPQTAGLLSKGNFAVAVGCILGAGIGNKLLFIAEMPQVWMQYGWFSLALGQTIVGGLLGGLLGVEIAKKLVGIRYSTGDLFVVPLAVGIVIGRIGCFLAGLHDGTYGVATDLPWGVDFGDGIPRHPTQLYDMLWVSMTAGLLQCFKAKLSNVSGLSFKLFLAGYLLWRLMVDGIKPVPYEYWLGLSGIQWGCAIALVIYLPLVVKDWLKLGLQE